MGKEILTFGDIGIEKNKFYRRKSPVPVRGVDIEKVRITYDDDKVKPLDIMLSETSAYVKQEL